MNDILLKLREEASQLQAAANTETFIEKKMKEYAIDDDTVYPDPEYLIEIGGVPTLPKGDLVALSAKWKNGKTFLCDILSAIFLDSDHFAGCRSLRGTGRVVFYDTEQGRNDTSRIKKTIRAMIPQQRHKDLDVFCLRTMGIDNEGNSDEISRFDFINQTIIKLNPDLVIIDGIADLIYNYNDVIESQEVVNKLASIATENNCCVIVVMHQNKGSHDRNMKGHLGTMLFQKCSDVFNVEKCGTVFVVSHAVSRHKACGDFVFKLNDDAIPVDGAADHKQQLQLKRQDERRKLVEQMATCFEDATVALKRSDIVGLLKEKLGASQSKAYELFRAAVGMGALATNDHKHYFLKKLD